ncbi:unnamed protein product [Closterium sp. NIES-65]|nr:unnamed protein product [Closterium sp. NIES-65]
MRTYFRTHGAPPVSLFPPLSPFTFPFPRSHSFHRILFDFPPLPNAPSTSSRPRPPPHCTPPSWMRTHFQPRRYTGLSCKSIDTHYNCEKNGRPNLKYLDYEWRIPGCSLKRFAPSAFLARNKVCMIVGDSHALLPPTPHFLQPASSPHHPSSLIPLSPHQLRQVALPRSDAQQGVHDRRGLVRPLSAHSPLSDAQHHPFLTSFDPAAFLALMRNKVFMIVGDSYALNLHASFRCLIESVAVTQSLEGNLFNTGVPSNGFRVPSHNATTIRTVSFTPLTPFILPGPTLSAALQNLNGSLFKPGVPARQFRVPSHKATIIRNFNGTLFKTGVPARGFRVPSHNATIIRIASAFLLYGEPDCEEHVDGQGERSVKSTWTVWLDRVNPEWADLLPFTDYVAREEKRHYYLSNSTTQLAWNPDQLITMQTALTTLITHFNRLKYRGLPMFLSFTSSHYGFELAGTEAARGAQYNCTDAWRPIGWRQVSQREWAVEDMRTRNAQVQVGKWAGGDAFLVKGM